MIVPGSANPLLMAQAGDPLDELGKIERSVRLRASAGANFSKVLANSANRRVFVYSAWIKRGKLTSVQGLMQGYIDTNNRTQIALSNSSDELLFANHVAGVSTIITTSGLFRDPSAHGHVVVAVDTTQATAANRVRIWWNGVLQTLAGSYVAQNTDLFFNYNITHYLGNDAGAAGRTFDGYFSHKAFIDNYPPGVNSANWASINFAEYFGQFHPRTGQWRPKTKAAIRAAVAGSGGGTRNGWGANGFLLPFDDTTNTTTLGYDRSQSDTNTTGNNWTAANVSLTPGVTYDSMLDTPTNNFATLNSINGPNCYFMDGALKISERTNYTYSIALATQSLRAGIRYAEVVRTAGNHSYIGVSRSGVVAQSSTISFGSSADEFVYYSDGRKMTGGVLSAYGAAYTTGDIIGVKVNADAGTVEFFKNGVSQGVAFSGLAGELWFGAGGYHDGAYITNHVINFGQQPFAYPQNQGIAKTLCTKNLPVRHPVMKSTDAFVARTNSGANSGANIVVDLTAASPWSDWIRIYKRRDAAEGWRWQFSDDAGNFLDSSSTAAKAAFPALGGSSYVGYALRVSAQNGVATGRLVHTNGVASVVNDGLANSRKAVILKNEATGNWFFYHPDLTAGKLLYLNLTSAETTDATINSVTASGFTVAATLASGTYRWISLAEVDGFLKLGKFTGNGSADGTFAWGGLLAGFNMIKNQLVGSGGYDFCIGDVARSPNNAQAAWLFTNQASGENTIAGSVEVDVVCNGKKIRTANAAVNGTSLVYLDIAAFPFRYANAR